MRGRRLRGPTASPPRTSPRSAALALLGRRDYTARELTAKLADRGHAADAVAAALDDLRRSGLVDDRRVAAAHVRTGVQVKGRGRLRLARELEARGVEPDLITGLLADLPVEDEVAAIERHLARRRSPARLTAAEHRRLYRQLLARGFPPDTIADVFRRRRLERQD